MTPQQLQNAANEVAQRWPTADLKRNDVGNLIVCVGIQDVVAYIDLLDGEVVEF